MEQSGINIGGGAFPPTRWSLVLNTRNEDSDSAKRALEDICRLYWDPLYSFIRRSGFGREDAQDLVQEFLSRVLERGLLDDISAEKGKLRSWLLALLKPFLNDRRKFDHRLKRGGGIQIVSFDLDDADQRYSEQSVEQLTPEKLFQRRWAISILSQALVTLGEDYEKKNQSALFAELHPHLQWQGDGDCTYAKSAERLGMKEGAIKVAVHRLRQRYRAVLRQEVANTLGPEEDVDAEIRHIFSIFAES